MGFSTALSLYSPAKINLRQNRRSQVLQQGHALSASSRCSAGELLFPLDKKTSTRKFSLTVKAASGGVSRRSASSRKVYRESQVQAPAAAPVKEIASFILPAGAFFVVTFVLWKLIEKVLVPKPAKSFAEENKSTQGEKWSFAPGTNILSAFGAKVEIESKQRLNEFAKELRSFRTVDISGCNFGNDGLYFLAESLAYNKTAEEVNFAANGITADGIKAFDGVLQSNIALKTLDLSGNLIGDEGAKALCDILMENSGIQKLRLNSTGLADEGAKAIAELLKKNSTLRTLELNNNLIDHSGFSGIAEALLENKSIQVLHLNGNYGGALGAAALAKGLEGNTSLRDLFLHGNSVGDEGICALITGLSLHKGEVTSLGVRNNSISARGAFHVAEYIQRSKSLRLINMSMNDIGDEGAEKIAVALRLNRSLTDINLSGNDIHAKGATSIAQVFKDNSVVTLLEIGCNPIGPDGVKALAEVLKFHGNINKLMLDWCQIGLQGTEFIADMLKYNNTISVLDLQGNGLRDEGAICLARSLKVVNETLTKLDLGFNDIRDEGAFAIAQALKANEDVRLTSLNFVSNFITKLGKTALTDARDHVYEMNETEVSIHF
ncbi:hypothetical protein ACH5RR_030643 [Cinchona calisaya]|uniref:Uncharacterized protein n=1 Tax=Cinchona calisaya TaxID=153742 RepID=A0ABD2YV98_9GENT